MEMWLNGERIGGERFEMSAPEPFDYAALIAANNDQIRLLRARSRRLRWLIARDAALAVLFLAAAAFLLIWSR